MPARPILLVDDYPLQHGLSLLVGRRTQRQVVHARTFERAVELLEEPFAFSGLLIDIQLSEAPEAPTGLDLLALVREREPRVPAAMLTGKLDVVLVARAAELGALYVPKPATVEKLEHFFHAVRQAGRLDAAIDAVLERIGVEGHRAPARLLRWRARGLSPDQVRARLGIEATTYSSHCRYLCRAGGCRQVADLVDEILRALSGVGAEE